MLTSTICYSPLVFSHCGSCGTPHVSLSIHKSKLQHNLVRLNSVFLTSPLASLDSWHFLLYFYYNHSHNVESMSIWSMVIHWHQILLTYHSWLLVIELVGVQCCSMDSLYYHLKLQWIMSAQEYVHFEVKFGFQSSLCSNRGSYIEYN